MRKKETRKKELAKLAIKKVLLKESQELIFAREEALIVHSGKNISASGDAMEVPVRDILRKKLPNKYYVGQGHIVDKELNLSSQQDILISDNLNTPILFTSNITEYFPYESVYAFGEVKTTYDKKKKQIQKYSDVIRTIKTELYRNQYPKNVIHGNVEVENFTTNDVRPFKNPLFTFMFFTNSGDFEENNISDFINASDPTFLPNVICILDLGCIVYCRLETAENGRQSIEEYVTDPEFVPTEERSKHKWILLKFGRGLGKSERIAANFGFFYFFLQRNLNRISLLTPELYHYYRQLFDYTPIVL